MSTYEVIVGNIGLVYAGSDQRKARLTFADYKIASEAQYGRAAGEDITLLKDGEFVMEHVGTPREETA